MVPDQMTDSPTQTSQRNQLWFLDQMTGSLTQTSQRNQLWSLTR